MDQNESPQMTEKELREGDKRFERAVEDLKQRRERLQHGVLQLHHDAGRIAMELDSGAGQYGRRKLGDLAADMGWSADRVRACYRFFRRYTPEELERVKEFGLPWRAVRELTRIGDKEIRTEIEDKMAAGEMKSDEVRTEVTRICQERRAAIEKPERGCVRMANDLCLMSGS